MGACRIVERRCPCYNKILPNVRTKPKFWVGPPQNAAILFWATINDLCLSICLWVLGSTHVQGGAMKRKNYPPKFADEDLVLVADNASQSSM